MSNVTIVFDKIANCIREEMNHIIQEAFQDSYNLYRQFNNKNQRNFNNVGYRIPDYHNNPHPWSLDLREMAKMLASETELPHIIIKPRYTQAQLPAYYEQLIVKELIQIESDCKECMRAYNLRQTFIEEKNKCQN